ncbi:hypothetical protein COU01_02770 [Candidatus Falkowbacteria bacterium CG10_big_fil_rev_8_21_14_0_10_44_15]|uniref:Methyltransferase domain-containing protein n=1 Tax=Candidatus Falkowbacteria bacterium CG10_big_fil_rev_8_21_14_0_10_44_15 TaxID=1974569 RepID=A0A2H0UZJ1_9BACT|nr:MAG: hypothetical protein COU01_02770 [Candidatus Falkowbacteria bacterium CG10_big_fil_rev_8_21_14_0_10_44_15]
MHKKHLKEIKKIYESGENIISYLKKTGAADSNSQEMIVISYDLQSGSYIQHEKEHGAQNKKRIGAIAKVISGLGVDYNSILEAGVGEATTLANVITKLKHKPEKIYGFDASWSRVRYAIEYAKSKDISPDLFMADLFNIPLADNSVDIVYTSHSIEPNGGREKEALKELMRVTNKYLILLEPAYELASGPARKRMEEHGYVKNLYKTAVSLGLNIIEHKLFEVCTNPLNPTGLMIIKKDSVNSPTLKQPFICPVTKQPLRLIRNSYFSVESLLAYPIIDKVPCLLEYNAVIATHYMDDFSII